MGKKCIPGVICIENMTLFVLVLLLIGVVYFYYVYFVGSVYHRVYTHINSSNAAKTWQSSFPTNSASSAVILTPPTALPVVYPNNPTSGNSVNTLNLGGTQKHTTPISDPYSPPLTFDSSIFTVSKLFSNGSSDIWSSPAVPTSANGFIPINIRTNSVETEYRQVGILTKNGHHENTILPLMGRSLRNGRDKWQYYSMSNSAGSINTKLPISVNGRSCTGEYGCDSISNGDTVYVEGYNDTFRATIYENGLLSYLPF
jgi:hypothetical protein